MKQPKVFLTIGLSALLAIVAAGCGASAPSGGSGGGSSGSGAPSSSPAWGGPAAWNNLTKLTNYSFQTSVNMGGSTMTINEKQHDPHNYQMTIGQGGQTETFILAGGHNYMGSGSGFIDLGAANSSSASTGLQQAASTWQGFLGGNGTTYAGPCNVNGRAGNAFNLKVSSGLLGAAVTGTSANVAGKACVDAATGVLLSSNVQWTYTGGGKSATMADTFQLTGMGNVPVIPVPSGVISIPGGQGQG